MRIGRASVYERALLFTPAIFAFVLALRPVDNFDLGFILRIGQHVLERGIPVTDPFSFPGEGKPWALEQWLGPLAFWLAHAAGGIRGVIVFKAAICALAVHLAQRAALAARADPLSACIAALLAAAAGEARFNAQPNVLTTLGVAAALLALHATRARGSAKPLFALPLLFALWVHVHPGYLSGIVLLGAFGAGAALDLVLRRPPWTPRLFGALAVACAGSAAAAVASLALFHPLHLAPLWRVLSIFSSDVSRSNIAEYAQLGASYPVTAPIVVLLVLPPLGWVVARRLPMTLAVPWALFGLAELRVGRLVAEASVVLLPALADSIASAVARLRERGQLRPAPGWFSALPIAAAAAGIGLHLSQPTTFPLDWPLPFYPRACYAWIDAHPPPPRGFNDLWFGGSFIFHWNGVRKTFIDGRSFYSDRFFVEDYLPIREARPGWQEVARKWNLEWYLLTPFRFRHLHEALARDGFRAAYRDEQCVVYVRR